MDDPLSTPKDEWRSREGVSNNLATGRLVKNEYGYLEIAKTGHPITPEMVKELSEDEIA